PIYISRLTQSPPSQPATLSLHDALPISTNSWPRSSAMVRPRLSPRIRTLSRSDSCRSPLTIDLLLLRVREDQLASRNQRTHSAWLAANRLPAYPDQPRVAPGRARQVPLRYNQSAAQISCW